MRDRTADPVDVPATCCDLSEVREGLVHGIWHALAPPSISREPSRHEYYSRAVFGADGVDLAALVPDVVELAVERCYSLQNFFFVLVLGRRHRLAALLDEFVCLCVRPCAQLCGSGLFAFNAIAATR